MTVGNLFALVQTNIKRLLGYSSIAQAGYLMVGLAAFSGAEGGLSTSASSVMFFLGSYAVTNLGAFIVIIAISARTGSDEIDRKSTRLNSSHSQISYAVFCLKKKKNKKKNTRI